MSPTPRPGELIVVTGNPTTAAMRWIDELSDPDRGTVVVAVRPGMRHTGWLARDLLAAVGKRFTVAAKGRDTDRDWQLVPLWYAAHQITDLIVTGAQALAPKLLDALLAHTRTPPVRLWLLADNHLPDDIAEALGLWPTRRATLEQFTTRWRAHHANRLTAARPNETAAALDTPLPASDFPTFRADCRRLLDPDTFAQVDQRYRHAFAQARQTLADRPRDAANYARLAHELLDDCATTAEMTIAIRALQATAFLAGDHLHVHLPALLAAGEHMPTAARRNPATWQRLRCYRQPLTGAACALAAAGLDLTQMRQLTIDAISAHGHRVQLPDETRTIEPAAAPLLAAQQLQRRAAGAPGHAPLFVDSNDQPLAPRRFADAINRAATEAGVAVANQRVAHRTPDPASTLRHLGLTVQPLTHAPDTAAAGEPA